jgi:hypothetical protein
MVKCNFIMNNEIWDILSRQVGKSMVNVVATNYDMEKYKASFIVRGFPHRGS